MWSKSLICQIIFHTRDETGFMYEVVTLFKCILISKIIQIEIDTHDSYTYIPTGYLWYTDTSTPKRILIPVIIMGLFNS